MPGIREAGEQQPGAVDARGVEDRPRQAEPLPESPGPEDFAVIETGARSVGADPDQVGPSASKAR